MNIAPTTVSPMTVAQVRAAEEAAMRTVREATLMARAADAVAAECEAILVSRHGGIRRARIVVLAGTGNNGGDALLAGARLHYRGAEVTAVLTGSTAHAMSVGECQAAGTGVIDAREDQAGAAAAVAGAALVIDGIVGIGSSPGLRSPADALVSEIDADAVVVAVDIPSGLDADSGAADLPHVRADVTVTFTAPKPCLVEEPAAASAGRVVICQVGVPRSEGGEASET